MGNMRRPPAMLNRDRQLFLANGPVPPNIQAIIGGNAWMTLNEEFQGTDLVRNVNPGTYFPNPGFFEQGFEDNPAGVNRAYGLQHIPERGWYAGFLQDRGSTNLRQYNHQLTQYPTWGLIDQFNLKNDIYSVSGGIFTVTPRLMTPAERAGICYIVPPTVSTLTVLIVNMTLNGTANTSAQTLTSGMAWSSSDGQNFTLSGDLTIAKNATSASFVLQSTTGAAVAQGLTFTPSTAITGMTGATNPQAQAAVVTNTAGSNPSGTVTMSISAGVLNSGGSGSTFDFPMTCVAGGALSAPGAVINCPDYVFGSEPIEGTYTATGPNGAQVTVLLNVNWNRVNRFLSMAIDSGGASFYLGCVEALVKLPGGVYGLWDEMLWSIQNGRAGSTKGEVDFLEYITGSSISATALQDHIHNSQGGVGGSSTATVNPSSAFVSIIVDMHSTHVDWWFAPSDGAPAVLGYTIPVTSPNFGSDPLQLKSLLSSYALGANSLAYGSGTVIYTGTAPAPSRLMKRIRFYNTPGRPI